MFLSDHYFIEEMADRLAEVGNTAEDHEEWDNLKQELETTLASADKEFKEVCFETCVAGINATSRGILH